MKNTFEAWFSEWFEEHYGDGLRKMREKRDDETVSIEKKEDEKMYIGELKECMKALSILDTKLPELSDLAQYVDTKESFNLYMHIQTDWLPSVKKLMDVLDKAIAEVEV